MIFELVVRSIGYGIRCSSCGRVRETTRFIIRKNNRPLSQFLLCEKCRGLGHVIQFNVPFKTDDKLVRRRRIKTSRKLEKGVAEDIGGYTTPGSGNQDEKADIRKMDEWRIEHKYTDSIKEYKLKPSTLDLINKQALQTGEYPAVVIAFRKLAKRFVAIPYETFLEIVEILHDKFVNHKRPK